MDAMLIQQYAKARELSPDTPVTLRMLVEMNDDSESNSLVQERVARVADAKTPEAERLAATVDVPR